MKILGFTNGLNHISPTNRYDILPSSLMLMMIGILFLIICDHTDQMATLLNTWLMQGFTIQITVFIHNQMGTLINSRR
jgi:hypothetical protein